jgi:hypothetical protein
MEGSEILFHTPLPELVVVLVGLVSYRIFSRRRYAKQTRERWSAIVALVDEKLRESPYIPEPTDRGKG